MNIYRTTTGTQNGEKRDSAFSVQLNPAGISGKITCEKQLEVATRLLTREINMAFEERMRRKSRSVHAQTARTKQNSSWVAFKAAKDKYR